jgi:hypothetical protein
MTPPIVRHPFIFWLGLAWPMIRRQTTGSSIRRPSNTASAVGAFCAVLAWLPVWSTAAVYECKGTNGSKVLTDRPKDLRDCKQIETLAPSPSVTAPRLLEVPRPPDLPSIDQQPAPAPAMPATVLPPVPPPPTLPNQTSPKPPEDPPSSSQEKDARRCSSGINPLNPLAEVNCPPAATEPASDRKAP